MRTHFLAVHFDAAGERSATGRDQAALESHKDKAVEGWRCLRQTSWGLEERAIALHGDSTCLRLFLSFSETIYCGNFQTVFETQVMKTSDWKDLSWSAHVLIV